MRQISRRRLASGSPGDRSDPRAFKMQFTKTRCWHGWWMRDSWSAIRMGIEPTIEIAHEALIRSWTRLHSWLRADKLRLAALAEFELWVSRWKQYGTLLVSDELVHAEAVAQHCAEDLGLEARALLTASRRRRTRSSLAATFLLSIGAITLLTLLSLLSERMRNDFDGLIMIFLLFVVIPALAFIVVLSVVIRLLWKRVASALSRLRNQSIG
jgi:hypothetical protein